MLPSRGHRALTTICILLTITSLQPCLAEEYIQKNITDTPSFRLQSGISSVPAPVTVAPDQDWKGIDGAWNTFSLLLGGKQTNVRVFISTASQQIWAIDRRACISDTTDPATGEVTETNALDSDCENSRGFLYNGSDLETWYEKGYYQLWVGKNLGLVGNGHYGLETVGLGLLGEKGPTAQNITLGTLATQNFWIGHIGLHAKPTNFSVLEAPVPSYITTLFDQKSIPSVSFGYTAGAQYHDPARLGSLTLGGYDASRFVRNNLTLLFAPNNERDLVVSVAALTANTTTRQNIDLLVRKDVTMYIDSTVAELYLPVEICEAFEDAFGLEFDDETDLYFVNDTLHQHLLSQRPSITFTLGQKYSTNATVQITLPYAALDLEASPPYRRLKEKTRYFPIRRGNDSDQWVLGRTFLQEAYLTVDWERQNFSLSAVDWTFGNLAEIVPIVSPSYTLSPGTQTREKPLSSVATIGIAVAGSVLFALVMAAVAWWFYRRRRTHKLEAIQAKYGTGSAAATREDTDQSQGSSTSPLSESAEGRIVFPKAELPRVSIVHHEIGPDAGEKDVVTVNEVDGIEAQIYEMPGDIPERQEADGRQLSEKETMVVRERLYNGVGPTDAPQVSPITQEPPRRYVAISPSEVSMVSSRLPTATVSPMTPGIPGNATFLETSDTCFQLPQHPRDGRSVEAGEGLFSPTSPLGGSTGASRLRFSYES